MMLSPKGLADKPRGVAWPPPARVVRCPVKSGNERDRHLQLLAFSPEEVHSEGTARAKREEGVGDGR